jgi:hypothetical protein
MKDKKFLGRISFWVAVAGLIISIVGYFNAQTALTRLDSQEEIDNRIHSQIQLLTRRSFVPSSNEGGNSATPNP